MHIDTNTQRDAAYTASICLKTFPHTIRLKGTPERVRTTGLRHSILNKHPKEVNFGNCIY